MAFVLPAGPAPPLPAPKTQVPRPRVGSAESWAVLQPRGWGSRVLQPGHSPLRGSEANELPRVEVIPDSIPSLSLRWCPVGQKL